MIRIVPLLILTITLGVIGCDNSREELLISEIEEIRSDISSLKLLKHEVRALDAEIVALKKQKTAQEPPSKDQPIFSRIYQSTTADTDDPFLGPKDSEVMFMAFGDFQCKPCKSFFEHSLPKLKDEFINTNKLKFLYRDLPLNNNKYATVAAFAAHCAGEQGAYWELFSLLFENQDIIEQGNVALLFDKLPNIDLAKLNTCIESGRYEKEVIADASAARELGAQGAPGFFIGKRNAPQDGATSQFEGVFVRGAQPYPVLRAEIQKVLSQSS